MPLNESEYWDEEIFRINLILINLDALNFRQKRMKLYLSCESIFSNAVELGSIEYDGKLKFVQFNSNVRPFLSLSIKLPDNRLKLQVKNLLTMLIKEMVSSFSRLALKFSEMIFRAFHFHSLDFILGEQHQKLSSLRSSLSQQQRFPVEMHSNVASRPS